MKEIEEYKRQIENALNMEREVKKSVREILQERGPVSFDWESCEAPSYASGEFDEDLTDVYITKLYLDGDLITADLHAYYLGDDLKGVDLADEMDVDWVDILQNLIDYTAQDGNTPNTTPPEDTDDAHANAISLFMDMYQNEEDYPDAESIISALRSLNTERQISDSDYDYIMENWEEIVERNKK